MNYLKGTNLYLSGPIQYAEDSYNWRTDPTKIFRESFGIEVFDPFEDPKQNWVPFLQKAQENKDYQEIRRIAKQFVRKDLGKVDRCDFLVAYIPYKVPTSGTVHEIIESNNRKKPTLLVSNQNDISFIPAWYYGFIKIEFMFPNWTSLFNYLKEVDDGLHRSNDRWSFVYGDV